MSVSDTASTGQSSSGKPFILAIFRKSQVRYAFASAMSIVMVVGVTNLLHYGMGLPLEVSNAIALIFSTITNYFSYRYIIFPTSQAHPFWRQFGVFVLSTGSFRGVEYLLFLFIHSVLGVNHNIAMIGIQGVMFVAKYFYFGKVVFRSKHKSGTLPPAIACAACGYEMAELIADESGRPVCPGCGGSSATAQRGDAGTMSL